MGKANLLMRAIHYLGRALREKLLTEMTQEQTISVQEMIEEIHLRSQQHNLAWTLRLVAIIVPPQMMRAPD